MPRTDRLSQGREKLNNFSWSLKPLVVFMKFVLGLNLNCNHRNSFHVRFLVPGLGFFIILCNFFVNGPCNFNTNIIDPYEAKKYDSAFTYVAEEPNSLVKLVGYTVNLMFLLAAPIIHITFMANVLFTQNWTDLWAILDKIQRKMKLNEEFHQKCRRHCFVGLFLLLLVNIIYFFYLFLKLVSLFAINLFGN